MNNYCVFIVDEEANKSIGFIRLDTTDIDKALEVATAIRAALPSKLYVDISDSEWTLKERTI